MPQLNMRITDEEQARWKAAAAAAQLSLSAYVRRCLDAGVRAPASHPKPPIPRKPAPASSKPSDTPGRLLI